MHFLKAAEIKNKSDAWMGLHGFDARKWYLPYMHVAGFSWSPSLNVQRHDQDEVEERQKNQRTDVERILRLMKSYEYFIL